MSLVNLESNPFGVVQYVPADSDFKVGQEKIPERYRAASGNEAACGSHCEFPAGWGFVCLRPSGHTGDHITYRPDGSAFAHWWGDRGYNKMRPQLKPACVLPADGPLEFPTVYVADAIKAWAIKEDDHEAIVALPTIRLGETRNFRVELGIPEATTQRRTLWVIPKANSDGSRILFKVVERASVDEHYDARLGIGFLKLAGTLEAEWEIEDSHDLDDLAGQILRGTERVAPEYRKMMGLEKSEVLTKTFLAERR